MKDVLTRSMPSFLQKDLSIAGRRVLSMVNLHAARREKELSVFTALEPEIPEAMMNVRLVAGRVLILLLSHYISGQEIARGVDQTGPPARVAANSADAAKQNIMRQVGLAEAAVRKAEAAHESNIVLSKAYVQLALWYENAAQWNRSEAVLEHAVSLLRGPSVSGAELATAISQLASLHATIGKLRESEKENQEALTLGENLGDPLLIARSRDDLAILYLAKQKYQKARDLARQAEAEFVKNVRADVLDRISARFTLAEALCNLKDCPSAIPLLKAALDETKTAAVHLDDFTVGLNNFLLGYAYWKSGDLSGAGEYMARGTDTMSLQLGWGHPSYLKALKCYAQFLHENRQSEAANVVERRIRQAEAVVDVHSIQTAQGMFGIDGSH
ncbi:MAG TPA: tetratricopeptide repeat protein [Edaphobacter sp.]